MTDSEDSDGSLAIATALGIIEPGPPCPLRQ
jgi:hypothetical protein